LASVLPRGQKFGFDVGLGVESRGRGHNVEDEAEAADNATRPKSSYIGLDFILLQPLDRDQYFGFDAKALASRQSYLQWVWSIAMS